MTGWKSIGDLATGVARQLRQGKGNYPNHPLFRIAPLLDTGFQTVSFDPYERVLVARIRAGRYVSDLFDCNSLYLGYSERLDRYGASPAERQGFAVQSRYKMTPEQLAEYRRSLDENDRALRAKRAARDAEAKAERERVKAESDARRARREAEQERRTREWTEEEERSAILRGRWECSSCLKPATITAEGNDVYVLECRPCGKSASADHATLFNIMLAREARHQTANAG